MGHVGVGLPDLVALVEDGRAPQGEEQEQTDPGLGGVAPGPPGGEPEHVVVRARPHRPGPGGQAPLDVLDDGAHGHRVQRRVDEREVEGHVQLVAAGAVVGGQGLHRLDRRLPEQHPLGVPVGEGPPVPEHLVDLGPVGVVHRPLPEELLLEGVLRGGRRVVPQLRVLDDDVAHVDAEAGHSPVEPEGQDRVEGGPDVLVPPVEVGLLDQMVVEVVLPGVLVERPGRSAEAGHPVVGRRSVGLGVGPHVPVAMRRRP